VVPYSSDEILCGFALTLLLDYNWNICSFNILVFLCVLKVIDHHIEKLFCFLFTEDGDFKFILCLCAFLA
jgi:hypothetical protein